MAGSFNQIEKIGDYTVITASLNYARTTQLLAKRGMDILGGLVGCIITLIVKIFVGPAIYIASPGPIFFAQERIGRNGRKFKMYKFRSMYMDAEERKKELMAQNKVSEDDFTYKPKHWEYEERELKQDEYSQYLIAMEQAKEINEHSDEEAIDNYTRQ